ncbi:MAG: MATE family efflux transporter [Anaerotruncus massiliensis (ex Togo et al. 2019)]
MKLFVNDRGFYKSLMLIAVPIALQNLITVAVSMMDTLMIGQLGEVQLSATSIANQLWFMLMVVCFGVAGGANVLIAQYWGKRDVEVIRRVEAITYKIGMAAAVVFSCVALFFPRQFMGIFTTEEAVIDFGVQYLRILGWSYPFYTAANLTIMMLRSVGTVNISIAVYLASLVVNTSLNYVLIFGKFGAPRLEVRGGAIATVCARLVEFGIAAGYLFLKEKKIRFSLRDLLPSNRDFYRKYFTVSIPVIGNELMWGIGTSITAVVIGRMGTNFVAANSIYTVINQLVSVMIFGVGNAALTVVGNTIGAGEYEKAKQRSVMLLALSVVLFGGGDAGARAGGHLLLQLLRGDDSIARGHLRGRAHRLLPVARDHRHGGHPARGRGRCCAHLRDGVPAGVAVPLGFVTGSSSAGPRPPSSSASSATKSSKRWSRASASSASNGCVI